MMNQPDIKLELVNALAQHLDPAMGMMGFCRPRKGLEYSRAYEGAKQQLAIAFASNPSYAKGMLAHITPSLRIQNDTISDLALALVGDPKLLADAPQIIQNHRLTMVPTPQIAEWYVRTVEEFPAVLTDIRTAFESWGAPFLVDYSTPAGIVRQHEAGDSRPLRQKHWYVFVMASYLLIGRRNEALRVLESEFGSVGMRRKYAMLHRNMEAEPSPRPYGSPAAGSPSGQA